MLESHRAGQACVELQTACRGQAGVRTQDLPHLDLPAPAVRAGEDGGEGGRAALPRPRVNIQMLPGVLPAMLPTSI